MIGQTIHYMIRILLFTLVIALISTGCQDKNDSSWSDISLERLCHFPTDKFETMNEEEVKSYITENYDTFERSVQQIDQGSEFITIYRWKEGRTIGDAILKDGLLVRITIHNLENSPTFGEIISNFGEPNTVYRHAEIREKVLYDVGIDYVEIGISANSSGMSSVHSIQHDGQLAIKLRESMRVDMISCYRPNTSMEKTLRDVFFTSLQGTQIQLQRRTAWPGFKKWLPLENIP